jgi:hypothetical protein
MDLKRYLSSSMVGYTKANIFSCDATSAGFHLFIVHRYPIIHTNIKIDSHTGWVRPIYVRRAHFGDEGRKALSLRSLAMDWMHYPIMVEIRVATIYKYEPVSLDSYLGWVRHGLNTITSIGWVSVKPQRSTLFGDI